MLGPSQLLNECRLCNMKFENNEQLANHQRKFCAGSDFADLNKLEVRYRNQLQQTSGIKPSVNTDELKVDLQQNNKPYLNSSIEHIRGTLRSNDDEFQKLEKIVLKNREHDLQSDLQKLKQDRLHLKAQTQKDDQALIELMKELELKKERELRARIEKDQIRKALIDLEKNKLTVLEQDRKKELQKLQNEREALALKEKDLMNEITKLEENKELVLQMRNDESEKLGMIRDGLKNKISENKQISNLLVQERSDKITQLKFRREQLENDRIQIMDNLEKIKAGEIDKVRKKDHSKQTAQAILNDMNDVKNYNILGMKEKMEKDQQRLYKLKQEQNQMYKNNHVSAEIDEILEDQQIQDNTVRAVKQKISKENNENNLRAMREKIQEINYDRQYGDQTIDSFNDSHDNFRPKSQVFNQNQSISPVTQHQQFQKQNRNQQFQYQDQNQNKFDNQIQYHVNNSNKYDNIKNNLPPAVYQQFLEKDMANEKLKQEINQLKQKIDHGNNFDKTGTFALKDIQSPIYYQNDQKKGEFFLANEVRSVDLSEEERTLLNIQSQEVDALNVLSRIPIGTELYRFKMEQYKDLSTTRSEIEKIVQEQRLQRLRRDFEKQRREEDRKFENEKWIDDQRKLIISMRLRKDTQSQAQREGRKYDPTEGLIIHWDFTLGIPKRNDYCQKVFAIYANGETVYSPKLIEPHPCEVESPTLNRCVFGESHQIFDVPANPESLLIFEIQLPGILSADENQQGKTQSYGWTVIDLFDQRRDLKRGKYKCPIYYGPTDPHIMKDQIKDLMPIENAWSYIRIAWPNDDEFGRQKSLYPENVMNEYVIPTIHSRQAYYRRPPEDGFQQQQKIIQKEIPQPQPKDQQQPPAIKFQTQQTKPAKQIQPKQIQPKIMPTPVSKDVLAQYEDNDQIQEEMNQKNFEQQQDDQTKRGVSITIHQGESLKNRIAKSHQRIMVALLEGTTMIIDENGNPCSFNTTIHSPFEEPQQNQAVKKVTPLNGINPIDLLDLTNKANGVDIVYQEEYKFLRNFRKLLQKNKKDLYLGIQLIEKPEPKNILTDKDKLGYTQNAVEQNANYGGLEFELQGWYIFKMNNNFESLKQGKFTMKLYEVI